jgi:O-antigen/teichoic acid export membrane protein
MLRHSLLAIVFHVAPRFANVLIFILIGRMAGPREAGIFSLAATYLLIITTVMRGLDDLLTRQVAREPVRAANYLGNFLLLRLTLSTVLYAALIFIVQRGLDYPPATNATIAILGLSVFPDSLTFVAQSVLLAERRFGSPAAIHSAANLIKLVMGGIILLSGGGLEELAWIWLGSSLFALVLMLAVAFKQVGGLRSMGWLDFTPLRAHWRAVMIFTLITTLTALDSQTDTVLLSIFRTEAEIGWYGAATTITFSLLMLSQAYRFAAYPQMTRYAQNMPDNLARLFQKSVHYMAVLVLPMVAGILLMAPQIVNLVFGPKFAPTIPVLRVLIVSLLFMFIGEPITRLMLVKDKQRSIVMFLLISATSNVILNLILIPVIGAVGAAIARTVSAGIFFLLNCVYVTRHGLADVKFKWILRPASAVVAMAAVVWIASSSLMVSIVIGCIVYVIAIFSVGGIYPEDALAIKRYALVKLGRLSPNGKP